MARIIRVHQDQADDLVLFQNQADRWNAVPGLTSAQRAAVREYEAAIGELRRLNAEVLAAVEQLKPTTIESLLARSDLEVGIEALLRGWPGTGLSSNRTDCYRLHYLRFGRQRSMTMGSAALIGDRSRRSPAQPTADGEPSLTVAVAPAHLVDGTFRGALGRTARHRAR